jgi:hypothetical protein
MINKLLKHGKGSGADAVKYLLDEKRHIEAMPEVIKGSPEITIELCEKNPHKWKYLSGVLSFEQDDRITEIQKKEIIAEFEKTAFGELGAEQYNILWVQHTDKGRTELHYIIPRMELTTGNSLTVFPPYSYKRDNAFRDYVNKKYNLADPTDESRKRFVKVPDHNQKIAKEEGINDIRQEITDAVQFQIATGKIKSLGEVKDFVKNHYKVKIERETDKGISISNPAGKGRNIRLKGDLFCESNFENASELAAQSFKREYEFYYTDNVKLDIEPEELADAEKTLRKEQAKWNEYLMERYPINRVDLTEDIKDEHRRELVGDIVRRAENVQPQYDRYFEQHQDIGREFRIFEPKIGRLGYEISELRATSTNRTTADTGDRHRGNSKFTQEHLDINKQSEHTRQKIDGLDKVARQRKQFNTNRISHIIKKLYAFITQKQKKTDVLKPVPKKQNKVTQGNPWITFRNYRLMSKFQKNNKLNIDKKVKVSTPTPQQQLGINNRPNNKRRGRGI